MIEKKSKTIYKNRQEYMKNYFILKQKLKVYIRKKKTT